MRRSLALPDRFHLFLYTDVYFFLKYREGYLNNKFDIWSDYRNIDPDNQWVGRIDPQKSQAILPLPVYHMGSDNYYMHPRCRMMPWSFQVSMKTGLPVTAIYLSRASISQSIKNIALALEPYREFRILKDLPDKRPFLVVAARCNEMTADEMHVLAGLHAVNNVGERIVHALVELCFSHLYRVPDPEELHRDDADQRKADTCNENVQEGLLHAAKLTKARRTRQTLTYC